MEPHLDEEIVTRRSGEFAPPPSPAAAPPIARGTSPAIPTAVVSEGGNAAQLGQQLGVGNEERHIGRVQLEERHRRHLCTDM